MTHKASNTNNFPKQNRFTLEEKFQRFGQSVADILLQCDPKDWSRVKKWIFCGDMKKQKITKIVLGQ